MVGILNNKQHRRKRTCVCSISLCFTLVVSLSLAAVNLFEGSVTLSSSTDAFLLLAASTNAPVQHVPSGVRKKRTGEGEVKAPTETTTNDQQQVLHVTEESPIIASPGFNIKPRIVSLVHEEPWSNERAARKVLPIPTNSSKSRTASSFLLPFEHDFYNNCQLPSNDSWTLRPTCNMIHEIGAMNNIQPISFRGSWRSVWSHTANAVLKQLHFHRDFSVESFHRHAVDAMAMEQLTVSPHVANLYGMCGPSVVTESATGSSRLLVKEKHWTPVERLELGRNLSQGLADIHAAGVLHRDINMANVLNIQNRLIFNDFNIGVRLRTHNNTTVCPIPVRFPAPLWRAPEEIRNTTYVDGVAADIYGLGNLLFQVLTSRQPWTHMEPDGKLEPPVVAERKLAGLLPYLPLRYSNVTAASRLLTHAVHACWKPNATERPTAARLVQVMDQALQFVKTHPDAPFGLPTAGGKTVFDPDQ